jgi:acetyl-CoA carboxylase carboxyltransferase component
VLPTFNINKQIGVFADFANFYARGQNVHVQLFGALHEFSNRSRLTPFVFTGIGNIRNSNAGTVTNSFTWFAGSGFKVRLTRWVAFQTIPLEYVMNTAGGNVGNNFVARAGLALTIPKH